MTNLNSHRRAIENPEHTFLVSQLSALATHTSSPAFLLVLLKEVTYLKKNHPGSSLLADMLANLLLHHCFNRPIVNSWNTNQPEKYNQVSHMG